MLARLPRVDFDNSVLLRFVASRFTNEMTSFPLNQLRNDAIANEDYGAALSLLLLVRPEGDLA